MNFEFNEEKQSLSIEWGIQNVKKLCKIKEFKQNEPVELDGGFKAVIKDGKTTEDLLLSYFCEFNFAVYQKKEFQISWDM